MTTTRRIDTWLADMDGVLVHEDDPIHGAADLLDAREPYVVGQPDPLLMRSALNRLKAHSETTVMIGHRTDTDVVGGLEPGRRTNVVGMDQS